MKHTLLFLGVALLITPHSRTLAASKPTLERGWIGGEFQVTKGGRIPAGHRVVVYVKQVYPDSPSAQAGLRPGDLILGFDGQETARLRDFRRAVDAAKPGSRTTITVFRDGQRLDLPLTVGREMYQRWHSLSFGLHLSSQFDLWPNPGFSLLPLGQYKRPQTRIDLRSPEAGLVKTAPNHQSQGEAGVRSEEGWDVWFLLFGLNSHKRILTQEVVPPATAMR